MDLRCQFRNAICFSESSLVSVRSKSYLISLFSLFACSTPVDHRQSYSLEPPCLYVLQYISKVLCYGDLAELELESRTKATDQSAAPRKKSLEYDGCMKRELRGMCRLGVILASVTPAINYRVPNDIRMRIPWRGSLLEH